MAWRPPHNDNSRSNGGRGYFQSTPGWQYNNPIPRPRGIGRGVPGGFIPGVHHGYGRGIHSHGLSHYSQDPYFHYFHQTQAQQGPRSYLQNVTATGDFYGQQVHSHYQSHAPQASHQDEESNSNTDTDIKTLECVWQDNRYPDKTSKTEALYKSLVTILGVQSNPWKRAFQLIISIPDYSQAKPTSLSFSVLLQFHKWVHSSDNVYAGNEEQFLPQTFRIKVFYATTDRHISYFNTAVEAFHLCHPGNEYFLPLSRALLLRDRLAEAAQVVSKLSLYAHFSRDEILVPLLLTDRVNLIEMYIKESSQQQMLILNLLDYLCARKTDIISFIQSTGLKNVKTERMSKKSLSKLAVRLMKMFDVPEEMCPNIADNRAMSAIRFLLYKRYIEKTMTADCWDDMVESVIGINVSRQQQFIMELMSYNDIAEAARWAHKYQLPDSVLDPSIVEAKGCLRNTDSHTQSSKTPSLSASSAGKQEVAEEEDWGRDTTAHESSQDSAYYTLPLRDENVVVVDTLPKLKSALSRLTKPSTVVGIDCEWKPIGATRQVALMQLAVSDCVFLVDFVMLEECVSDDDWKHFAQELFCNDRILKIGYGFDTDLRMLCGEHPSMREPLMKMKRVMDLAKLADRIEDLTKPDAGATSDANGIATSNYQLTSANGQRQNGSHSNGKEQDAEGIRSHGQGAHAGNGFLYKNEEKGLSLLARTVLGKPLCKDEQMSNWEKRPLRRKQILYASMDAFVLLEIRDVLTAQGQSLGLSQEEMEPAVIFKPGKAKVDKKKQRSTAKKKPVPSQPIFPHATKSCRPFELRVVCDSMMQGLGSQLRSCGVDALILSTGQIHEDAIQIALRENRIILTSGFPYEQVRARVGDRLCYCVPNSIKAREQCVNVLKHFKVEVNVDDIFSRCAVCNFADFCHIAASDMEACYVVHQQNSRQPRGGKQRSKSFPDLPDETRQRLQTEHGIEPDSLVFLHNRSRIQIETIPSLESFRNIQVFFVCVNCGKVYWKGSHWERIQENFHEVLTLTPAPQINPGDVVDLPEEEEADPYQEEVDSGLSDDMSKIDLQALGYSGVWCVQ